MRVEHEAQAPTSARVKIADVESLVLLAHESDLMSASVGVGPAIEREELDSIRQLREIVLDTMAVPAEYRSSS